MVLICLNKIHTPIDESDSSVKSWCIADAIWNRWGWTTLDPWILSPVLRIMRSACHNTTFICQMPYLTQEVLRSASKCFSWEPSKYNWLCPKIGRALSIPMFYHHVHLSHTRNVGEYLWPPISGSQ
jgi:hypothetical protein